MDNPGVSLFNNGLSLQVNAVKEQEREEEEEEAEEERRIEAELAEKLEGAFDDLDLDDGDDSSLYSPPPHIDAYTPGQVPLKYLTSTPFPANGRTDFQSGGVNKFYELPVEETRFEEEDTVTYNGQGQAGLQDQDKAGLQGQCQVGLQSQGHHLGQGQPGGYQDGYVHNEFTDTGQPSKATEQQINGETGDRYGRTVKFPDQLNKSDTEKVRERIGDPRGTDQADLLVLYTARGREIERLEGELGKTKADYGLQLRTLRQQLATIAMEKQHQNSSCGQLEALLADSRRENKLLKEDLHALRDRMEAIQKHKDDLEAEHAGDREAITQLQKQLQLLQSSDTVLKARQQHDAVVRAMKEREEQQLQQLRLQLDAANTAAKDKDNEVNILRSKFTELQDNYDYTVRDKSSQIDELSGKLAESRSKYTELSSNDQSVEVHRLRREVEQAERRNKELAEESRKHVKQIKELREENAGYEAMAEDEASDSIIALGLSGSKANDGSGRLKEELHRSLAGNKSKREELARLNALVGVRDGEVERLRVEAEAAKGRMEAAEKLLATKVEKDDELVRLRSEVELLKPRVQQLQTKLELADKQNIEVKKCMTAMLEGNDEDKMEAIDSLREEYEEHCSNAVQETKRLMEGEVRRLNIELDVYNKTVMELRKKLDAATKLAASHQPDNSSTADKTNLVDTNLKKLESALALAQQENCELKDRIEALSKERSEDKDLDQILVEKLREAELACEARLEEEFTRRVEKIKSDLREMWESSHKGDVEEAVARARLDWLKRLPDIQREGGAARESVGQLDLVSSKLSAVAKEKDEMSLQLSRLTGKLEEKDGEVTKIKMELEILRKTRQEEEERVRKVRREEEERTREELKSSLSQQQVQWQGILSTARQESEVQRQQILKRYEEEVGNLESRVRRKEEEKTEIETKLDQIETEYNLARDKWKRVLEDKNKTINNLKNTGPDLELVKAELGRKVLEADEQRAEMGRMAERWAGEVRNIQQEHNQERQELEEVSEKYRSLKSKVRKYQRHVESKENHYKQEYTRLETEFKSTLERLRARMEMAYTAKEREVEKELGTMRDQFTQELRNIAARKTGVPQRLEEEQFETESLKKYYIETSNEIQKLMN